MTDKIHQRVAEVLGMELEEEDQYTEGTEIEYGNEYIDHGAVVAVPESAVEIDNPELPALQTEMTRIEHGQQQTEVLLNRGIATVQQALAEIAMMPPVYKARAMEAASELFKAVADLGRHKVEIQIKLIELKMKQAAFTRNKQTQSPSPLGTGNTFVINREDLMRAITTGQTGSDAQPEQS